MEYSIGKAIVNGDINELIRRMEYYGYPIKINTSIPKDIYEMFHNNFSEKDSAIIEMTIGNEIKVVFCICGFSFTVKIRERKPKRKMLKMCGEIK